MTGEALPRLVLTPPAVANLTRHAIVRASGMPARDSWELWTGVHFTQVRYLSAGAPLYESRADLHRSLIIDHLHKAAVVRQGFSDVDTDQPIWLAIGLDLGHLSTSSPLPHDESDGETGYLLDRHRGDRKPRVVWLRGDRPVRAEHGRDRLSWDWPVDELRTGPPEPPSIPAGYFVETYTSGLSFVDEPSRTNANIVADYTYAPGHGAAEISYVVFETVAGTVTASIAANGDASQPRGRALAGALVGHGASLSVNADSPEALAVVQHDLVTIVGQDERATRLLPMLRREVRTYLAAPRRVGVQGERMPATELPASPGLTVDEPPQLSTRERKVLHLIEQGLTRDDIALQMKASPRTMAREIQQIAGKLRRLTRTRDVPYPQSDE